MHERYQEILQEQTQTQSDIDQWKAYYEAAGREKKRRVYGLGSQAKCYYGPNQHGSSRSDASSSIPPSSAQSGSNLDELVTRLIPALTEHIVHVLTDHMLPVLTERVREMILSPYLLTTHQIWYQQFMLLLLLLLFMGFVHRFQMMILTPKPRIWKLFILNFIVGVMDNSHFFGLNFIIGVRDNSNLIVLAICILISF